jgi:hypothetical protein
MSLLLKLRSNPPQGCRNSEELSNNAQSLDKLTNFKPNMCKTVKLLSDDENVPKALQSATF